MIEEKIYQEYNQWKETYKDLILYLKENDSLLLVRYDYIFEVLDYLFDKLIDDPTYTETENEIFVTGFLYLKSEFITLTEILNKYLNNSYEELNKKATTINLLLNVLDLENDFVADNNVDTEELKELKNLENDVRTALEKKETLSDEYYDRLDKVSQDLIGKVSEYHSVHELFLEIANELELI
ncbi:conserved hypothetical protein [Alteracholeplasma palmae J233]|uniref:Uncharacterized protein n=1 Tax=Alteracholeplasma palmae (strain ATCC 49389 / J233) TaxID=1318466 RepID=U4KLU7_ALTPJ|nr:hypothetical protein [Alteracholeplasma palmae]CCV64979.1 conserved hypothetical protein [Alteracholeplasma palmae J233]